MRTSPSLWPLLSIGSVPSFESVESSTAGLLEFEEEVGVSVEDGPVGGVFEGRLDEAITALAASRGRFRGC